MCVASAFLYPNMIGRKTTTRIERSSETKYEVGWPLAYEWNSSIWEERKNYPMVYISAPNYLMLGGNIAISLAVMTGLWMLCKSWHARRKKNVNVELSDLLSFSRPPSAASVRISLPDDPMTVQLADVSRFKSYLEEALSAFGLFNGNSALLVCASINSYHRSLCIRFVQGTSRIGGNGEWETGLRPAFSKLRDETRRNGGDFHHWGGNNYFDVSLQFSGPMRLCSPKVDHLPWNERYLKLLEVGSWDSLRDRVFRFGKYAELFASQCVSFGKSKVFIPSTGLCVHPWQFALQGLQVIATDAATAALDVVSQPLLWPRLYSRMAFERWDAENCSTSASQGNFDHFEKMPDLQCKEVSERLRKQISFAVADWSDLPLTSGCVDAIFATNALPRDSSDNRNKVLREWTRVMAPGGLAFIAQHNFFEPEAYSILQDAGWKHVNIMQGERPSGSDTVRFQISHSSG